MSRVVSGLEDNRLARRKPSPDDARALRIEATKKGRQLMLKGQQARVDGLVRELKHLNEKDLKCLHQAVKVLKRIERRYDWQCRRISNSPLSMPDMT